MKRVLKTVYVALLVVAMILSLVACGKKPKVKKITTSTNKTKVEIEIGTSQEQLRDTLGEPSEVDFIEHYETYYIDGTQVYIYFDVDEEGNQVVSKVEVPKN
jgi:predicted small lipoprotein YifL